MDLGLERAGMRIVWQCEADKWRRGILARHWPHTPCGTDVREWQGYGDEPVDLICGGFPCQDLSVAGRRAGLHAGARSSLFFEFARIADTLRPRWLLVENVPGLLSSHGGRDFAVVLATLAEIGYGVAWRVLDSRFFGVAQRRRRVFIVGYLGADGPEPFLPFLESGARDTEAGIAQRKDVAYALTRRAANDRPESGAATLVTHALTNIGHDASEDGTGRGTPIVATTLSRGSNPNSNAAGRRREDDENLAVTNGVRRLTPVECCRLQGFPDDWFGDPNEPPDSPKYAALGDAVTVNVAEWIGRRIIEGDMR